MLNLIKVTLLASGVRSENYPILTYVVKYKVLWHLFHLLKTFLHVYWLWYVHMCFHMCVRVHVYPYIWRPDFDTGCYPWQISAFFPLNWCKVFTRTQSSWTSSWVSQATMPIPPSSQTTKDLQCFLDFSHGFQGPKLGSSFLYRRTLSTSHLPIHENFFILLKVPKKIHPPWVNLTNCKFQNSVQSKYWHIKYY